MKLWRVSVVDPKKEDRRKSRFRIILTVHAKSEKAARSAVEDSVYVEGGRKIIKVAKFNSTVFGADYFYEDPRADF